MFGRAIWDKLLECIFDSGQWASNYKSASGQLQNNTVDGAMTITISRVIKT